ncbi:MAG TPA: class I SAM-dependent methyltransferase [Thermoanaerobaculia bacterium]
MREREVWDEFWTTRGRNSLFERLSSFLRYRILAPAVRTYTDRFFPFEGVFVECGCGTGQSSSRISKFGRRLIALDVSMGALRSARAVPTYTDHLQADIRQLPFPDGSISGIWNLGVMEHFEADEGQGILVEFRRVLEPGRAVVLFWPPNFSSTRWILGPIERVLTWWRGKPFRVFPDEVNRLRSRRHAFATMASAGFQPLAADFTFRDWFIHIVAVGRKPLA